MYQKFGIAETFGVPAPAGLVIEGFADANHPHRPAPKEYVFGKNLRDILAFLHEPYGE